MSYSKNRTLKQYTQGIFQHLLSSQFVYPMPEEFVQLKRLRLKIQTRKQKKIHYMYLWLFTRKIPYLRKFRPSWKNTSRNILLKTKAKSHSLQVTISSKNKFAILYEILMQMISKQTNSEKQIWNFQHQNVQAMIFAVPLTERTYSLQMKNTYFPSIPLVFQFQFSNTTAFQKLFFLRALKILSPVSKIPALDSFF
jgi:hypothetical protein